MSKQQEKPKRLSLTDRVVLECIRKDGTVRWRVDSRDFPGNSMAQTGMAQVAALILTDVGGTAFDYVGIGTSQTGESALHEDLLAPVKRKAATGTQITTEFPSDTAQWVTSYSSADSLSGSSIIAEVGVFNAISTGVMLFRKLFPVPKTVVWDDGDTLQVTATCQMMQGE